MLARLIFLLMIALVSSALMAQTVYRWVDESGEVHYGHSVPTEHAHRGYDRMGPDGTVRERVERTLTPEERAERAALRSLEEQADAERRSQESRDRLLLSAYQSEQDILNSLETQVASLNSQRLSVNQSLERTSARFESLVSRAAQLTRDGQNVPAQLNNSIQETRAEARRLRASLEDIDHREASLRERFDEDLERFRQLTGGG